MLNILKQKKMFDIRRKRAKILHIMLHGSESIQANKGSHNLCCLNTHYIFGCLKGVFLFMKSKSTKNAQEDISK